MKERLTGSRRFRADKKGRLILQVERDYYVATNDGGVIGTDHCTDFRDAKVEDISIGMLSKGVVV